jgi:hypothetical protein
MIRTALEFVPTVATIKPEKRRLFIVEKHGDLEKEYGDFCGL